MSDNDLLKKRIKQLRSSSARGKCVLYIMSRDQRVQDNHALLAAQKHAAAEKLPLAVVFCLYPKSRHRAREHFSFMLSGLKSLEKELKTYNIPFMMVVGKPLERLSAVMHHTEPDAVYFDFNPLRGPQRAQQKLCKVRPCKVFVVDTHNVVPVWEVSDKREVGAYTLRPKLHKRLAEFLVEPEQIKTHPHKWPGTVQTLEKLQEQIDEVLQQLPQNNTQISFASGEESAYQQLEDFTKDKLHSYAVDRNDPSSGSQSDLSPYLHFGQISTLRVALRLQEEANKLNEELHFLHSPKMPKPEDAKHTTMHGINALIEEMIVRKELADNFCYYDEDYDNLASAPTWARTSLDKHRNDPREHSYTLKQLEQAQTHDSAWNASQRQLTKTGKMHGYMRMYWAKKVLEWSPIRPHNNGTLADFSENFDMDGIAHTATRTKFPEEIHNSTHSERSILLDRYFSQFSGPEWAVEVLKYLNDFYSIDGGDPNGYAGILWSVGGVHDRPWQERDIFGVIRYMNYGGLKRKFEIEKYEKQWQ